MAKIQDFMVQVVDKFNDKTTTTVNVKLGMNPNEAYNKTTFSFRHVSTPNGDNLIIDVYVQGLTWGHYDEGMLTFHINGSKNMKLSPHNQEKFVDTIDHTTYVFESNFYIITQEQLKELCDAQSLDIQLSGRGRAIEMSGEEFISYCQLFYNQFFDESSYSSAVTDYWPSLKRSANWNKTKQTAKNAFEVINDIHEGCSGMAILLLTLGGGVIWAVIKLIEGIIA